VSALAGSALCVPAFAEPLAINPEAYAASQRWDAPQAPDRGTEQVAQPRYADTGQPNLGGGFLELLFGGPFRQPSRPPFQIAPAGDQGTMQMQQSAVPTDPRQPDMSTETAHPRVDPRFDRQVVAYEGREEPGTIVIDTPHKFLFLVEGDGKALRYGIGVGKPGFTWAGVKTITAKREWPDWRPPDEMLRRRPDLPRYMAGGPENPLGARAMYLGSTLYRIHGSNEPWTIGTQVSSGCIRMRNDDVSDLYTRVKVGTKVVVI
jgi:lipoprotein-anchoring transpeptidase ErfK/SrfK